MMATGACLATNSEGKWKRFSSGTFLLDYSKRHGYANRGPTSEMTTNSLPHSKSLWRTPMVNLPVSSSVAFNDDASFDSGTSLRHDQMLDGMDALSYKEAAQGGH